VDLTNIKSGAMSRNEQRGCKSEGSVQVEEGRSSQRKVRSWTWKYAKPLVDLTEEAEQEQEQN